VAEGLSYLTRGGTHESPPEEASPGRDRKRARPIGAPVDQLIALGQDRRPLRVSCVVRRNASENVERTSCERCKTAMHRHLQTRASTLRPRAPLSLRTIHRHGISHVQVRGDARAAIFAPRFAQKKGRGKMAEACLPGTFGLSIGVGGREAAARGKKRGAFGRSTWGRREFSASCHPTCAKSSLPSFGSFRPPRGIGCGRGARFRRPSDRERPGIGCPPFLHGSVPALLASFSSKTGRAGSSSKERGAVGHGGPCSSFVLVGNTPHPRRAPKAIEKAALV